MSMQATLIQFEADIFHALSHPTRVAIIEILRKGETSCKEILDSLDVEATNATQHISVLRSKKLVLGRRSGHQVFYRIRDPLVFELLDVGRHYFQIHMSEALDALQELRAGALASK